MPHQLLIRHVAVSVVDLVLHVVVIVLVVGVGDSVDEVSHVISDGDE